VATVKPPTVSAAACPFEVVAVQPPEAAERVLADIWSVKVPVTVQITREIGQTDAYVCQVQDRDGVTLSSETVVPSTLFGWDARQWPKPGDRRLVTLDVEWHPTEPSKAVLDRVVLSPTK
jgi:hypothetical protein